MNYRLTKSKFIMGLQCEKALYLDVYKPQLAYYPPEQLKRFRQGRSFEALIKDRFEGGIDISARLGREIKKYPEMTSELLQADGEVTLFEAGFVFNEVLVLADVVQKEADGTLNIFEIKNSFAVKEVFRRDVCLQHYVIANSVQEMPGLHLDRFDIIYNNGKYNPLYEPMLQQAIEEEPTIARQVDRLKEVLQGSEPAIAAGPQCRQPYDCPFRRYCEGKVETQLELVGM